MFSNSENFNTTTHILHSSRGLGISSLLLSRFYPSKTHRATHIRNSWAEANNLSLVKSPSSNRDERGLRMTTLVDALAPKRRECHPDAADAAAGNEPHLLNLPGLPNCRFTDVHFPAVITALLPTNKWYWRESHGCSQQTSSHIAAAS
jgi:hypothetical protein